jgi:hypothetical protein
LLTLILIHGRPKQMELGKMLDEEEIEDGGRESEAKATHAVLDRKSDERRKSPGSFSTYNDAVTSPSLEAEILHALIAALTRVDMDSRSRLLSTVATFFDIGSFGRRHPGAITTSAERTSIPPSNPTDFSTSRSMSPKEFLIQKEPKTDVEKVACLAFYLTYYRETPHFKTQDITQINTEAAQSRFSNAAYAVENAVKQGYLVPAIKGMKQLGAAGEQFVQALPDREAAKAVLQRLRPRRPAKKRDERTNKA